MKSYWKMAISLVLLGILLGGCERPLVGTVPTGVSSPMATVETIVPAPTTTIAATVTVTRTPTITVTPSVTPEPSQTQIPTVDPANLPALLQTSLKIETLEPIDGQKRWRITGWPNGFDFLTWMGSNDLLLRPILETQNHDMGQSVTISSAMAVDLDSGKMWQPGSSPFEFAQGARWQFLPHWSAKLGILVAYTPEKTVGLYDPDGNLLKAYDGSVIGISPSGTRILVFVPSDKAPGGEGIWIDLASEKQVHFPWQLPPTGDVLPVWSDDEMQVYASRHLYGNAQTGESFSMIETLLDGKETGFIFDHSGGMWVLGGKYLLPSFHPTLDGAPGFLSVLDPKEKTYINVSERAGLPFEVDEMSGSHPCYGAGPIADPRGRYVWVNCEAGGWVVDLATFKSQHYPDYPEANLDWSADGTFAWIKSYEDPAGKILSVNSKDLQPVPDDAECIVWHPGENIFSYLSNGGQTISIFDVQRMVVQKTVDLPTTFSCAYWNDTADKIILRGEDAKVWQINYPALDNLQELVQTTPDFLGGLWSPDRTRVAYHDGADIYIVDVNANSPK